MKSANTSINKRIKYILLFSLFLFSIQGKSQNDLTTNTINQYKELTSEIIKNYYANLNLIGDTLYTSKDRFNIINNTINDYFKNEYVRLFNDIEFTGSLSDAYIVRDYLDNIKQFYPSYNITYEINEMEISEPFIDPNYYFFKVYVQFTIQMKSSSNTRNRFSYLDFYISFKTDNPECKIFNVRNHQHYIDKTFKPAQIVKTEAKQQDTVVVNLAINPAKADTVSRIVVKPTVKPVINPIATNEAKESSTIPIWKQNKYKLDSLKIPFHDIDSVLTKIKIRIIYYSKDFVLSNDNEFKIVGSQNPKQPHGQDVLFFKCADSSAHFGNFNYGLFKNGIGIEYSFDYSRKYIGEYKNDKKNGIGFLYDIYGNYYYGIFLNDNFDNGEAHEIDAFSKEIFKGKFYYGNRFSGTIISADSNCSYSGSVDNGVFSIYFANEKFPSKNETFQGSVTNDKIRNGKGRLTKISGNYKARFEGEFKNGLPYNGKILTIDMTTDEIKETRYYNAKKDGDFNW